MTYKIWSEIVEALAREPDRIFSLDDLENKTNIDRQNLQQALYRAYRRKDVERIAPGMYRFHDKYRNSKNTLDASGATPNKPIHIKEATYDINIERPSLRILDEMIGQLKYIRTQIKKRR